MVHVQYAESPKFTEVYGFSGSQGAVNCEGVRFTPKGKPSKTLAVFMHPSSTLQLLPMPQALAKAEDSTASLARRPDLSELYFSLATSSVSSARPTA